MKSLFGLIGKPDYPIPDYSTLCRRSGCLSIEISKRLDRGENLIVGIDSTGLKVYGEGEWKVRKHEWGKYRTWRKLHVCMDLMTQEILSVGAGILKGKAVNLKSFKGDGAYDEFGFREILGDKVRQVIPPPKNGVVILSKKDKPVPKHLKQ